MNDDIKPKIDSFLTAPKGYEYWSKDEYGENVITDNAPKWAKEEFKHYQELLAKNGKLNPEIGLITDY